MNLTQSNPRRASIALARLKDLGDSIKKLDSIITLIECVKADYQEIIIETKERFPEAVE